MKKKTAVETITSQLKSIQRVFNVTPRFQEIRDLLSDDLHSATDIIQRGEKEFVDRFSNELGGVESDQAIYLLAHILIRTEYISKNEDLIRR